VRLLTNVATLGVIVLAGCALAAPARAQTSSQSDMWIPDQPEGFQHGWFWDPTSEAWKYGWYQPGNIARPMVTREYALVPTEAIAAPMPTALRGRILSIEQRSMGYNVPPEVFVTVRTEDGTIRTLDLGGAQFVFQTLPDLRQNQEVLLRGNLENVAGRDFFNPSELVTSRSVLTLPGFATASRVRGTLVNLYTVPGGGDFEKILVAQVRTLDGNLVDVVLGPSDQVGNRFYSLRPGTPFVARGFIERSPAGTKLYAQNVRIQQPQQAAEVISETPSTLVMNVEPPAQQRLYPPPIPGTRVAVSPPPVPSVEITTAPPPAAPQVAATETVQGQITNLRSVWVGGQWRLVADVETDTGNFISADLGPRVMLNYLNLAPGDLITITGQRLFQGAQPMIVANQLGTHGQWLYVQTMPPPAQVVGAVEVTPAPPTQMLTGCVVDKRTEGIPGYKEERLVVDLRLDDGQVVPVDLGLKKCVKSIDIDRNDYITVWGQNGPVNGQPGLIAAQVQNKNKLVQVGRCD
jgi:hypothetical protein